MHVAVPAWVSPMLAVLVKGTAALLVRWNELPMREGHPLALSGWLEADQAELTVLHRPEDDGALRAMSYRFCASREGLEPTGTFAAVST